MNTPENLLLIFALSEEKTHFTRVLNLIELDLPNQFSDLERVTYHHIFTKNGYLPFFTYTLPRMGMSTSLRSIPQLLNRLKPSYLINIGLCAGINEDLQIGDVIICNPLYEYMDGAKLFDQGEGIGISPRSKSFNPSGNLTDTAWNLFEFDQINESTEIYRSYLKLFFGNDNQPKAVQNEYHLKVTNQAIITSPGVDISEHVKEIYKGIDRKMAGVEMEAYSIQSCVDDYNRIPNNVTLQSLYIKGVSDYGNKEKNTSPKDKRQLDRKLAMFNASMALKGFFDAHELMSNIQRLSFGDLDLVINKKHLEKKKQYEYVTSAKVDYNLLSEFFSKILDSKSFIDPEINLFDSILTYSKVNQRLIVKGFSGIGKSSLLVSLFKYMEDKYSNEIYPLFLDVEYYYKEFRDAQKRTNEDIGELILAQIEIDLFNTMKILSSLDKKDIVIIVDGIDYARDSEGLINLLKNPIRGLEEHPTLIYGVQSAPELSVLNLPKSNVTINAESVQLNYLSYDDKNLTDYIGGVLQIKGVIDQLKIENISNHIKENKLQDLDLFTIALVYDNLQHGGELSVSKVFDQYANSCLHGMSLSFQDLTLHAYKYHILREDETLTFNDHREWKLLYQNPKIVYFLIAKYIIAKVLTIMDDSDEELFKDLSYVFPHQINYFCKEIINESLSTQQEVHKRLVKILEFKNWHSKAVACYLIGRFQDATLKTESNTVLVNFLEKYNQESESSVARQERDKYLFAIRTVYISLAYLKNEKVEGAYIKRLIHDKEYDDINRGFHLVYYGDQKYIPKNGLAQKDYLGPFENTFRELVRRVQNQRTSNLFNVEVFTLLSLALHRLKKNQLSKVIGRRLIEVLKDEEVKRKITNGSVKRFVNFGLSLLKKGEYSMFTPLAELYKLKSIPRTGWVERGIKGGESVADHTLFAYNLALFYLPEESDNKQYNKDKILRMLLMHDNGEVRIGDLRKKTDEEKLREKRYFQDLIWVSYLFDHTNRLIAAYEDWEDFENGKTINGKIAREIDRLEGFSQLMYYKHVQNENLSEEDVRKWKADFEGDDKQLSQWTSPIFKQIVGHYNSIANRQT